jgi:hypothetical protein
MEVVVSSPHVKDRAPGIVALPRGDTEREAAFEHARSCTECSRELNDAERVLRAVDALPHAGAPSAAAMARVVAVVVADLEGSVVPSPPRPLLALVAAALLFAVIAKHHAREPVAWLEAAGALSAAAASIALLPKLRGRAVVLPCLASVALVLVAGSAGNLELKLGLKCVMIELVAAALPYATAAYGAIRNRTRADAGTFAAIAAAGALAGQAALHVTCLARAAEAHLLVFHLGGVILAAILGALASGPVRRAAT